MNEGALALSGILEKAIDVFGSREEAESWMLMNVMGLDGQRPIDLIESESGQAVVDAFLARLLYSVYS